MPDVGSTTRMDRDQVTTRMDRDQVMTRMDRDQVTTRIGIKCRDPCHVRQAPRRSASYSLLKPEAQPPVRVFSSFRIIFIMTPFNLNLQLHDQMRAGCLLLDPFQRT
jgi:hypothetical protein